MGQKVPAPKCPQRLRKEVSSISSKATPNIDFMLNMAKEYLDGTGNPFDFEYDYGYHFEKRYRAMLKEDRELTYLIYDCLVAQGSDHALDEEREQLKKRIRKQYNYVISLRSGH